MTGDEPPLASVVTETDLVVRSVQVQQGRFATSRGKEWSAIRAARVREIVAAMVDGRYSGAWARERSEAWGINPDTVGRMASEASRFVRMSSGDPEDIRAQMVAQLDALRTMAQDTGDIKAAISAVKARAELLGLTVHRIELAPGTVTPRSSDDDVMRAALKDPALRAMVQRELVATVMDTTAEEARDGDDDDTDDGSI